MAHTEKCRGCGYENSCDYISCRIEENRKIRAKAIDEFAERLKGKVLNHFKYRGIIEEPTDYSDYIDEVAEEMRGAV